MSFTSHRFSPGCDNSLWFFLQESPQSGIITGSEVGLPDMTQLSIVSTIKTPLSPLHLTLTPLDLDLGTPCGGV